MTRRRKLVLGGVVVLALGAGGVGFAQATGDGEENVSGPEADAAKRAGVLAVGGGRAVGVEHDEDDGAAWEVEVERDGKTLEVQLTSGLKQVGTKTDDDAGGKPEGDDGD